jgi:hypothetical protein
MLKAKLSFEEIAAYFKDKESRREQGVIITNFYHWSEEPLGSMRPDKGLFVCDDSRSWNNIDYPGMYLYEVVVAIKCPLILLEQWESLEFIDHTGPIHKRKLSDAGKNIDSIIATVHPWHNEQNLRQMLILNPKESVILTNLICRIKERPSRIRRRVIHEGV